MLPGFKTPRRGQPPRQSAVAFRASLTLLHGTADSRIMSRVVTLGMSHETSHVPGSIGVVCTTSRMSVETRARRRTRPAVGRAESRVAVVVPATGVGTEV